MPDDFGLRSPVVQKPFQTKSAPAIVARVRGAVEYVWSKTVRCRTVLGGGIRLVDGKHVFPGDLHISVSAVRNRHLDDRGDRLHSTLS